MAGWTGLEPATSGLTGQRSNQLNYHPVENVLNNSDLLINSGFACAKADGRRNRA